MRNWLFLLIVLILGILQVTVMDYFKIFGTGPDLLLIAVVIAGLIFDFRLALFCGLLAGVFKDSFGLNTFGINTLIFALWSFLIAQVSRRLSINTNFRRMALIFIVALIHNLLNGLSLAFSGKSIPLGIFLRILFISSIYTALALPAVFRITELSLKIKDE